MIHENITRDIIGSGIAVLNELRPGLDEKLYENALAIELCARGHLVEQQREFPVYFRDHLVGRLIPDLIVDDRVIVDPKVVTAFTDTHIAQMLGYLNITGLGVAILLNFKESRLGWKRIVRGQPTGFIPGMRLPAETGDRAGDALPRTPGGGSYQAGFVPSNRPTKNHSAHDR